MMVMHTTVHSIKTMHPVMELRVQGEQYIMEMQPTVTSHKTTQVMVEQYLREMHTTVHSIKTLQPCMVEQPLKVMHTTVTSLKITHSMVER